MPELKDGDRVRVKTREQTEEDVKSQMYFTHYGGMTGSIQKVYSNTEVAIDVELENLTKDIRKRHEDVRDQMKTKWLDGLSEEGRGKLTEREKDFNLRYVILVSMNDLEKAGPRPEPPVRSSSAPSTAEAGAVATEEAPRRKTLEELEEAEAAELLRRSQKSPN